MTLPCEQDPDLFFDKRATRKAKALCFDCDEREPCLARALRDDEQHGVFGGTDDVERAKMHITTPSDVICAIAECTTALPESDSDRVRRYCCSSHAQLGAHRDFAARQDDS